MARRSRPFALRVGDEELAVLEYSLAVPRLKALTPAEREVLAGLLAGQNRCDIARARGRSPATIARQVESLYRKLGVGSTRELAAALARSPKDRGT